MFYRDTYEWKWVCAQHPMVLIALDNSNPPMFETVEPWGSGSFRAYCEKVRDVLVRILETPEMKSDFDLSAKELKMLLEEIPECRSIIRTLLTQKRVGFVGCDYAQAHYHEYRSESALRQIEYGVRTFREELGYVPDTFMHQETGVFENLPQLLRAFGFDKAAMFLFHGCFEFLEAPSLEIVNNFGDMELVRDESIAKWRGLDGSSLYLFLPFVKNGLSNAHEIYTVFYNACDPEFKAHFVAGMGGPSELNRQYPTHAEENRGLYRGSRVILQCPDLVSLDEAYIQDRVRVGSFSLMKDALDAEIASGGKFPAVRLYTYWSYCEGEFGESLFRRTRDAERCALAAETLQAMAWLWTNTRVLFPEEDIWDLILTAQHHDITWQATRDFKVRAEEWLARAEAMSEETAGTAMRVISSQINLNTDFACAFNTLPVGRTEIVCVDADPDTAYELDGTECQISERSLYFKAELPGLGYAAYALRKSSASAPRSMPVDGYHFENECFSVTFEADGTITSLCSARMGELIARGQRGNLLKGMLMKDGNPIGEITNRDAMESCTVERGPLFDRLVCRGRMANIPYELKATLMHGHVSNIDFELTMVFDRHEIGDFWHDETKLHVRWPLRYQDPEISIDEPFGFTRWKKNRPMHPANLVMLSDADRGGFGIVHQGTPKFWYENGALCNLLAWGARRYSNRDSGMLHETTPVIDVRLDGECTFRYSVLILDGTSPAEAVELAARNIAPPTALLCGPGNGVLSARGELLDLGGEPFIATASMLRGEALVVRGYNASPRQWIPRAKGNLHYSCRLDAANKPVAKTSMRPFEIGLLCFMPQKHV